MKIKNEIECRARVSATLDESGTLTLNVFGQAEYAKDRTTTAQVGDADIPAKDRDAVAAALKAVLDGAAPKLGPRLARSISKSAEVAAAHGEI